MSIDRWMDKEVVVYIHIWHPTPVLLPGKSHGQRSLVGCSPWGHEESDTTERLHFQFSLLCIGEGNGNPLQCSCLENPRDGVAQSLTWLKWLSSGSIIYIYTYMVCGIYTHTHTHTYIYNNVTVAYYSTIKRKKFDSVELRWMNYWRLESRWQSPQRSHCLFFTPATLYLSTGLV